MPVPPLVEEDDWAALLLRDFVQCVLISPLPKASNKH